MDNCVLSSLKEWKADHSMNVLRVAKMPPSSSIFNLQERDLFGLSLFSLNPPRFVSSFHEDWAIMFKNTQSRSFDRRNDHAEPEFLAFGLYSVYVRDCVFIGFLGFHYINNTIFFSAKK